MDRPGQPRVQSRPSEAACVPLRRGADRGVGRRQFGQAVAQGLGVQHRSTYQFSGSLPATAPRRSGGSVVPDEVGDRVPLHRVTQVDQVVVDGGTFGSVGLAVPMSRPRYTCAESTLMISSDTGVRGRARALLAAAGRSEQHQRVDERYLGQGRTGGRGQVRRRHRRRDYLDRRDDPWACRLYSFGVNSLRWNTDDELQASLNADRRGKRRVTR